MKISQCLGSKLTVCIKNSIQTSRKQSKFAKRLNSIFFIVLLSACSTAQKPAISPHNYSSHNTETQLNDAAMYAFSLYDTPYKWGGTTRSDGFDCSGFVQYVYRQSLGLHLPRTSNELSHVGIRLTYKELRPGDLVFFNTTHRPYSHVGIYVGKNQFIHAPRAGETIKLADMTDSYWQSHFDGGRRISTVNN
jgi:cell wall-associated NlpC family hydrolase